MWGKNDRCPKCGAVVYHGCCTKCGCLNNGKKINLKENYENDELKEYLIDYASMLTNENYGLVLLLGLTYFSYAGYFILGCVCTFIELFILFVCANISIALGSALGQNYLDIIFIYFFFLCLFIIRYIETISLNKLCLFLDKASFNHIKTKYKDKYKLHLNRFSGKWAVIASYILCIFIIIIIIIIKRYQNGILF